MTCFPALPDIKTIYKVLVTKTFFLSAFVHRSIRQRFIYLQINKTELKKTSIYEHYIYIYICIYRIYMEKYVYNIYIYFSRNLDFLLQKNEMYW